MMGKNASIAVGYMGSIFIVRFYFPWGFVVAEDFSRREK
jgi:hypothetical protein